MTPGISDSFLTVLGAGASHDSVPLAGEGDEQAQEDPQFRRYNLPTLWRPPLTDRLFDSDDQIRGLSDLSKEPQLRAHVGGSSVRNSVLAAYAGYYRSRGKTYHVGGQLESVARKGRPIPTRAALVEAMFTAELEDAVLTAGHDLRAIELPIRLGVTGGHERYELMRGVEQMAAAADMMMADRAGIISTVLYGPDRRTQITADTTAAVFAAYAPAGWARRRFKPTWNGSETTFGWSALALQSDSWRRCGHPTPTADAHRRG